MHILIAEQLVKIVAPNLDAEDLHHRMPLASLWTHSGNVDRGHTGTDNIATDMKIAPHLGEQVRGYSGGGGI